MDINIISHLSGTIADIVNTVILFSVFAVYIQSSTNAFLLPFLGSVIVVASMIDAYINRSKYFYRMYLIVASSFYLILSLYVAYCNFFFWTIDLYTLYILTLKMNIPTLINLFALILHSASDDQ